MSTDTPSLSLEDLSEEFKVLFRRPLGDLKNSIQVDMLDIANIHGIFRDVVFDHLVDNPSIPRERLAKDLILLLELMNEYSELSRTRHFNQYFVVQSNSVVKSTYEIVTFCIDYLANSEDPHQAGLDVEAIFENLIRNTKIDTKKWPSGAEINEYMRDLIFGFTSGFGRGVLGLPEDVSQERFKEICYSVCQGFWQGVDSLSSYIKLKPEGIKKQIYWHELGAIKQSLFDVPPSIAETLTNETYRYPWIPITAFMEAWTEVLVWNDKDLIYDFVLHQGLTYFFDGNNDPNYKARADKLIYDGKVMRHMEENTNNADNMTLSQFKI